MALLFAHTRSKASVIKTHFSQNPLAISLRRRSTVEYAVVRTPVEILVATNNLTLLTSISDPFLFHCMLPDKEILNSLCTRNPIFYFYFFFLISPPLLVIFSSRVPSKDTGTYWYVSWYVYYKISYFCFALCFSFKAKSGKI